MEELRALRKAFDSKIRYDEVREGLLRSMSEELTQHRQNFHQTMLRPVLFDLISLYDDLTQVIDSPEAPPGTGDYLGFFRDGVEQVLARNGVQKYTVEGVALDRARQRVLSTVDTPDPALDRTVARRLRTGFTWDEKVLRPEWVSTYRHVPAAPAATGAGGTADTAVEAADDAPTAEHAAEHAESADRPGEGAPS
jgi:molecular chaperone GrpE (heat shock protein)